MTNILHKFPRSRIHLDNTAEPIDCKVGDPRDPSPERFRQGLFDVIATSKEVDRYSPKTGLPELRKSLADEYFAQEDIRLDPESEVCITHGAWQAIHLALQVNRFDRVGPLNRVGDLGVGYAEPNFFALPEIVKSAGMIPFPIGLKTIINSSQEELNNIFKPLNGGVFLHVDPHNPTGYVFTPNDHLKIAKACQVNNTKVVSDRVYKHLYDGRKPESFLHYDPTAIEIWSFSKSYRMAGWRVGAIFGQGEWMKRVIEFRKQSDNGVCVATQLAAIPLINERVELENFRQEIAHRRRFLIEGLVKLGFRVTPDSDNLSTNFVWAGIPKGTFKSSAHATKRLADFGVLVLPGTECGGSGEGYLRFALNHPTEVLEVAIQRIERAVDCSKQESA